MADALKLTGTSTTRRARAADAALPRDESAGGLGRDVLALLTLFFFAVTAHIFSPLLQHETHFGSAFRNPSLQPVMAMGLLISAGLFIRNVNLRSNPLKRGAALILIALTLILWIAVVLRFNLPGAILELDPSLFFQRLNNDSPRERLMLHATLTTLLMVIGAIATLILWQPWSRLRLYAHAIRRQTSPLIVAVVVLVVWEVLIQLFQIQAFLLPRPSVIAASFAETYPRLVSAGWNTFQNAFWGFVVGCGLGVLTGMIAARFTAFSRALLPVAVAINAIPIIALAPIMNNWFGALNPASKIAIVALLTYFPAMISTVKGLTSVDTLSLELMHSYAARPLDVFRKLRLPNALPFIFSALKVAASLSMIAAIVSEYFGGSTAGLGFKIRDDAGLFKYPDAWAAILMASLIGIGFYLVISAVERVLMHWHISFRDS